MTNQNLLKSEIIHPHLKEKLEQIEIEAPGCTPPAEVYAKLLAIYLYDNDLCNAKFLWKRIPGSVKVDHPELAKIWDVGKALWLKDPQAVFLALQSHNWSDNIEDIMTGIKVRSRDQFIVLLGQAYTSISLKDFAAFVGVPESEAVAFALQQPGWGFDQVSGMVLPKRAEKLDDGPIPALCQLETLTDFVAFLEK